jgi:phosphoribosylanthranilate isomerase
VSDRAPAPGREPGLVLVKVCGLTRRQDVLSADALGADYVGVVLSEGFSRSVAPASATALVEGTRARKVAVLVDEDADGAEMRARALGADVVQLHGDEPPELLAELRRRGPWTLWKAVRADSIEDVDQALARHAAVADGILVEGWRPGRPGGAGARLVIDPPQLRARMPADLDLVLAGGLTAQNVADAVERFRPDVVDASSGLERAEGAKDAGLVRRYIVAARAAARRAATVGPAPAAHERR